MSDNGKKDLLDIPEPTKNLPPRKLELKEEDEKYVPVIIKRSDTGKRHPYDILVRAIQEGVEQHSRKKLSLFLSSIAAGLILGFAGMSVALVTQLFPATEGVLYNRLAVAFVYPLGFVICILSGTQLFTEHTATAVYPVLDRKASLKSLHALWALVLAGNLVGTLTSSILLFLADAVIGAGAGYILVADHLVHFSFGEVFISAILAGWLMAQGGWLVIGGHSGFTQILSIYIVTFIIGLGGLHHSIVGSAEVFSGLLHMQNPDVAGAMKFLSAAVMGNLVGGSFFVGVLNYGHIKQTQ